MNTTPARRRPSRARSLAAAAALGLLLSACSVEDPEAPATGGEGGGGTFSIAVGIDPDTFDPAGQTTTTVRIPVSQRLTPRSLIQKVRSCP